MTAGKLSDEKGKFYPILLEPNGIKDYAMQEEIFGFVFVAFPYENEEELIDIVNKN